MANGTLFKNQQAARAAVSGANNSAINATDDSVSSGSPGTAFQDQLGNWFRYALNDSTVFAAKDLLTISYATCKTDTGTTSYKLHVTGDGLLAGPFAVALNAITAAQWGYVQCVGIVPAHVKGVVALGDALSSSAVTALKVVKVADGTPPAISIATAVEVTVGDADASIRMLGNNL